MRITLSIFNQKIYIKDKLSMSAERRRPPNPERHEDIDPPKMNNGQFYDLHPPSKVTSGTFKRVRCEFRFPQDPARPDSYMVSGVPAVGSKVEKFVLQFTDKGTVITPATEQEFLYAAPSMPKTRLN